MHGAGKLRQDRERIRIPFEQDLVRLDRIAFGHRDARAVNNRIPLLFAILVVHDGEDAIAVHRNDLALFVAHPLDVDVLCEAIRFRVLLRLLGDSGGRAADVERAHRQLRARFADRLRRDHAHRFAALDQPPRSEIPAVTRDAKRRASIRQVRTERILTRSIPAD